MPAQKPRAQQTDRTATSDQNIDIVLRCHFSPRMRANGSLEMWAGPSVSVRIRTGQGRLGDAVRATLHGRVGPAAAHPFEAHLVLANEFGLSDLSNLTDREKEVSRLN